MKKILLAILLLVTINSYCQTETYISPSYKPARQNSQKDSTEIYPNLYLYRESWENGKNKFLEYDSLMFVGEIETTSYNFSHYQLFHISELITIDYKRIIIWNSYRDIYIKQSKYDTDTFMDLND